jgi:hypothetical protein
MCREMDGSCIVVFQVAKTLISTVPYQQMNNCLMQIFLLWYSTFTSYLKGYIIDKRKQVDVVSEIDL